MSLSEIVNITITKETKGVSRVGFGTPMIVGPNATFAGRVQFYTDLASLATDLTNGTADPEYKAAAAIIAQNPRVVRFAIGREDVGDTNMTDSLNAINAENSDWYGFIIVDRTEATQLLAAAWAETVVKIFSVTDAVLASTLRTALDTAAYERTIYTYHALVAAADQYIDAALLGKLLPFDPGTYTAMFKTLSGISVDSLTTTESTAIRDENGNTYEEIGGRNIVREGKVSSGDYLDLIIFVDWLQARMQESVYAVLVNNPKVPYDDTGIEMISNAMESPLKTGQNRGAISPENFASDDGRQIGGYNITVPALEDIPDADKQNRLLQDVEFTAWYSGAIHTVQINGVVTL